MPQLKIVMDAEGAWPDLRKKLANGKAKWLSTEGELALGVLPHGMKSGQPSVAIRIDLPNGHTVVAETSAKVLVAAAQSIMAAYPALAAESVGIQVIPHGEPDNVIQPPVKPAS